MNMQRLVMTALGLAVALLAAPRLRADDSLARVRQAGKLVVAIDPTYPPMEFEEEKGKPKGFDIDFARELARRLGVEVEFFHAPWDGIIAGLNSRRYDVIISSMSITPKRREQMIFVQYIAMGQVFVCRPGTTVRDAAELAGKVVAVQRETTSHQWVEDQRQQNKIAIKEIKDFPDATDTFNALQSKQADVVVTDEPVGRYYAKLNPNFSVTGQAMDAEPIGVALHKEDLELRRALATAVEDMRADGTLQKLSKDWFGGALGEPSAAGSADFLHFSADVVLPRLWDGMRLTLLLTALSSGCGIALGLLLSLARIARNRLVRGAALAYVTLFRGTPLLLQIFFVFYALPTLLGVRPEAMTSGVLALSLNAAAYTAEIFRAAIQSIDKGQMEAARALGMSHWLAMRRVILPQTFRRLVPPLVNEVASLSKDTSLVSVLAIHEMLYQTNHIAAAYLRPWEVYFWAALGYLAIVLALTALAGRLEKHLEARGA
jgi:His/Glu/Gln/Arg/opine family amino acid ABC transporter permease subunit